MGRPRGPARRQKIETSQQTNKEKEQKHSTETNRESRNKTPVALDRNQGYIWILERAHGVDKLDH